MRCILFVETCRKEDAVIEKILLILESETMCKALSEALINYEVYSCKVDAVSEVLAEFCPDALILDLFLPGTDGFTLMEDHHTLLPPAILLLSVLDSDYVQKRAAQLGVDFIIRKPCSVDYIARHLADILMSRQFPDFPDNETLVDHLLSQFHLHTKERVLNVLRKIITLSTEDPDCLLTKDMYTKVCPEYGASTDAVDQAIRRCLRNAWLNRHKHPAAWAQFFPDYDTCPSNGVFIASLAAFLRKKYPSRFRKGS